MRAQDSNRSRQPNYRPEYFKYFDLNQNAKQARCKLCKNIIQNTKDGTGLLRLHLENVHSITISKTPQPSQRQFETRKQQPIQDYQSYQMQQYSQSYRSRDLQQNRERNRQRQARIEKSIKNREKWLNIFKQHIPSSDDEVPFQQMEEQMKFIVHGTQFTDPLKYIQFARYSDDQINEIKQQLSELPNLSKIPAMVTLAQNQDIQTMNINKQIQNLYYLDRNWQNQRVCITEIIERHKQKYQVKEWKIIQQENNAIEQNQQAIEIPSDEEGRKKNSSIQKGQQKNNVNTKQKINEKNQMKPQNTENNQMKQKQVQIVQIQIQENKNKNKNDKQIITVNIGSEIQDEDSKQIQIIQVQQPLPNPSQNINIDKKFNELFIRNPYIKSIRQKISPQIYTKICKTYKQSKNVTHIKYITPTHAQIFSVILSKNNKTEDSKKNSAEQQNNQQCTVYKHTVMYNESQSQWQCNCNREVEIGLPCCHIMKIVMKMKGSLQYYIHERWRPNEDQLQNLTQDWEDCQWDS